MRYIFYADVYFIQNFMIKVAVLYLALSCNKINFEVMRVKGVGKIGIASFMGTVIEIIGLLFSESYALFVLLVHLLEIPFMTWIVLGKNQRQMVRVIVSGYFFTMLINSILEVFWNQFGEQGSYLLYLLFSCGVAVVGVRIWKNYYQIQKGIFLVQLIHKGTQFSVYGFYDSGNCLKDPYTGKGVHIISEQMIGKLAVLGIENKVYIPYKALGSDMALLEVFYVDELIIEGEKQRIRIPNCPLGVTKDNLFEEKKYEMILNEEVF